MAVQGTPEQSAALVSLVHELQVAKEQLQVLQPISGDIPASQKIFDTVAVVDQSIAKLQTETEAFLSSFSPAQKSGLKDISKKAQDADSELAKQLVALDQVAKEQKAAHQQVADCAAGVDKTLANIQEDQLVLARQMGIILPSTELRFNLGPATDSMNIGATTIAIPVSADISRTSSLNGDNVFAAKLVADMSDLQDNIADLLRSQIEQSPACGEHIEVREAMLTTETPASRIFTRVHVEHWICPTGARWGATEVAAGEGSLELSLVPSIDRDGKIVLGSQISHVEGNDFARGLLLGNVGEALKDKITALMALTIQEIADSQLLPTSVRSSPVMDKAQFQQAAGRLTLVLDERLELSDQQTQEFASQVRRRFSAEQRSSP